MPSEKILKEKQQIVGQLAERMKTAASGVLVDYKGISVADDTKLRAELRKSGVEYTVVKNTLMTLAAREIGFESLEPVLKGTTALATSETDLVAPAKILNEFAKKSNGKFKIKKGFVEGNIVGSEQISALAELPPKEVLVAQVLGGLNAPITGFVTVLNGTIRGLAIALNAIAEKKGA